MDTLAFTASVIASLAWPATVVVGVVMLRKPLRELLPALQRLKYKDLEMAFGRDVGEVRTEVERALPAQVQAALPNPDTDAVIRLAEVSPRAAVQEAWRHVELAALEAARQLSGDAFRNRTLTFEAIRVLDRSDRIDRGVIGLLRELRTLRNQAVHAPDFALTSSAALDYAASAGAVTQYLRGFAHGA